MKSFGFMFESHPDKLTNVWILISTNIWNLVRYIRDGHEVGGKIILISIFFLVILNIL